MPSVPSSDSITLAVHDLGGEGPPMLLAHAAGFHGLVWGPLASHLDGHCWAVDLRGHGDSATPPGHSFVWSGLADDLLACVDRLDLDGAVGIGHSGGGAAFVLAEARRPGTFRSLYLYEPVVFPPDFAAGISQNPLAELTRSRRNEFPSLEAAETNFASKPPMNAFDPAARHAYVDYGFTATDHGSVRLKCRPEDEARVYEMGITSGAWDRLKKITCPVTVARGKQVDPRSPARFAERAVEQLPDGRFEEFDHLTHFGPLEDPATIAAAISAAAHAA